MVCHLEIFRLSLRLSNIFSFLFYFVFAYTLMIFPVNSLVYSCRPLVKLSLSWKTMAHLTIYSAITIHLEWSPWLKSASGYEIFTSSFNQFALVKMRLCCSFTIIACLFSSLLSHTNNVPRNTKSLPQFWIILTTWTFSVA